MSGSAVEIDFFSIERETAAAAANAKSKSMSMSKPEPSTQEFFERRRSFRDIQSVISMINPEVLKAVITSGSASASAKPPSMENIGKPLESSFSVHSTPNEHQSFLTPLPVYPTSTFRPISGCETAPLTIFYNGSIAVFNDVPRNKADYIVKVAQGESFNPLHYSNIGLVSDESVVGNFNRNLQLTRRKSLERFFEKRKQRLIMDSP